MSGKKNTEDDHGRYDNRGHRLFRATQTSQQNLTPLLKILRHTQGIVTIATTIGCIVLWDVECVYYVSGSLLTSFLAKALKKVIREERPQGSAVRKSSGMPSTHSSTISFMCTYLALNGGGIHPILRIGLVGLPLLVMWSRVRLGVHTPRQVIVGGTLGLLTGIAWNQLWLSSSVKEHPLTLQADEAIKSIRPW
ncbi:unnamed protein product [Sympodiomycopsis kandeliae]